MKLSFVSTMRKALVALTIATLGVAGLAATPAQAAGPVYATSAQLFDTSINVATGATNNEIVVPSGSNSLNFTSNYAMGADFFTTYKDKVITASATVVGPDGKEQNGQGGTAYVNLNPSINFCAANNSCDYSNWETKSLTAKATHTQGSMYVDVMAYMMGDMYDPTPVPLPAGKYTVTVKVLADGVEVPVTTNITELRETATYGRYWVDGSSYTAGPDVNDVSFNIGACVDSEKIATGDTVTLKAYVNDSEVQLATWSTYSYTRGSDSPSPRQDGGMNSGISASVTQNDIDYGLAMRATVYQNNPVLGTTYVAAVALVDQDGNNVAGDCAPPAPAAPTITLGAGGSLSATVTGLKFAMDSECAWFDVKDLTTPVATTWPMPGMPNTPATCSLSSSVAVPGVTYAMKLRGMFYMSYGAYSPASNEIKVPVPGYTINPAVSGGDDGGQASVVSTATDGVLGSSNVRMVNNGKGGAFRLSTKLNMPSCPPCGPSTGEFTLQAVTASGIDSGFAGTGSVQWAPTGANSTFANAAWYGANADKWTLASANLSPSDFKGQLEMIQGSNASGTVTSTTVAGSVLDATCATVGSGYSTKSMANMTSVSISPVSAATAKQLFVLYCFKPTTLADTTTAYLPNPVLVTIDNATTVNVVKVLGESSASANAANAAFSANPSAGSSDTALTILVTKRLVTGISNNLESGDNAGREIVRLKADLTSTTTTSGWATGTTTIATEPFIIAPSVNDGSFYVLTRSGLTNKLMKIPATGAASAAVSITNDKAADMTGANFILPLGVQSGSLTDITVMASSPTVIAPVSVKAATGDGKAGEIVKMTYSSGAGILNATIVDSTTKDIYWWFSSTSNEAGKVSINKWRDPLYVKPTGPVPAVTASDLQYATNTPAAGTKVTFTGTNLDLTTAVKFGTVAATIGTKTATSLQVTVPAGSTGTVAITLESANGNGDGGNFTYVGTSKVAQTVTLDAGSSNAKVGDADRTVSATVSMTGYTAVASLTYSSTTTSVCSVTGTTLKFLTKGTCTVKATQAGSSWTAEGVDTKSITVVGPTPTVTTQVTGKATNTPDAGTKLTIAGTNLGEVDAVKFGTVAATIGTRSATSLEVTVPAGSKGTVNITLAYSGGTVTAGTFEYVGAAKVAQAVTLNSGSANAAVGDADRTLSATVSMTGYTAVASLTYSSTTTSVCSVTGTTLKFLTKGTCTVKATQAGSVWAAEGVATANIAVSGPADQTITVRTVQVGEKQINPDGIFISAKASSGLDVTLVFSTPSVCKKGTYSAFHVINLKTGSCKISVVQEGNAEWAPATKLVTYTVTPAGTKKFVDPGNAGAPVAIGSAGAKTNVLSEVVSFKKSTGALTITSKGVWVGPVVATATFKISGKSYTCTLKYGTLKAVSAKLASSQKTFAAATSFCAGTKTADKAAVAALKKITEPVEVKITVWRDLHNPVKYATRGTQIERAIYVTIG